MKVSLLEPIGISKNVLEELAEKLVKEGHEFTYYDTKTTDIEKLKRRTKDQDIVMIANNPYPAEVVDSSDKLKMISVAFTGIDHVGVNACKDKNIMICNAAGYSNQTVAELTIGMAITALRNLVEADRRVRKQGTSAGIGGREIAGRTVGIVGLGNIGLTVAKLFQAFGAKVIAYNRSRSQEAADLGIEYKTLDEVMKESDIISVHLPLNDSTRGFISADKIALMKKDAVFINCARGPIVDNAALAEALKAEKIGYACIDVYDMEPPIPEDYPLLNCPNTFLTPHQAFISEESMVRRAQIVFDNVYAYIDGKPINVCE